jgi:hypothetical protein
VYFQIAIDESIRGKYYLIFVLIEHSIIRKIRKSLNNFSNQNRVKIHMYHFNHRLKNKIINDVIKYDIDVVIVEDLSFKTRKTQSRQICLRAGFEYAAKNQISRIMLDRSNTTVLDLQTYKKVKHKFPHLPRTIYHLPSKQEPLLWLADIFAWSYGAGGNWRKLVDEKVTQKITLV